MNITDIDKNIDIEGIRSDIKDIYLEKSDEKYKLINKKTSYQNVSLLYRWSITHDSGQIKYLIGHSSNLYSRLWNYIENINDPNNKSKFLQDARQFYKNTKIELIRLVDRKEDIGNAEVTEIAKYAKDLLYNQT